MDNVKKWTGGNGGTVRARGKESWRLVQPSFSVEMVHDDDDDDVRKEENIQVAS